MNECLLRAVASRARLFKAKMQSVFSSHCWEHFRISLSISYQAFFHTHGAFLLGTVSAGYCFWELVNSLPACFNNKARYEVHYVFIWFLQRRLDQLCLLYWVCLALIYIKKRGFFLHLNSWKWKCVTYLQILLTDAVGWFKQPWKLLKLHSFPFIHRLPYLNVLFVFFVLFSSSYTPLRLLHRSSTTTFCQTMR